MHSRHTTFTLAGFTVHRIDFDPATFVASDLRWLPHHSQLAGAVNKRQTEHLAGRLAAYEALHTHGVTHIAAIGERRQPLWPPGWFGSISHCEHTALAVVARKPVGIDIETLMAAPLCEEIADSIVSREERKYLERVNLPFTMALTLVFSAKESLYKTLSSLASDIPDFDSAQVVHVDGSTLTLRLTAAFSPSLAGTCYRLHWQQQGEALVTLATG